MTDKVEIRSEPEIVVQMSFAEFTLAIASSGEPPEILNNAAKALWNDKRGDWASAHACVQNDEGKSAAWVHAYLHRKEGYAQNASYWYARAGKPVPQPSKTLDMEWAEITRAILRATECE